MPFLATIASGSGGNAAVLSDGGTHILIDAGISAKRIREGLRSFDIDICDLAAILITHDHGDHISGLEVLAKHTRIPVYMTEDTANGVQRRTRGVMRSPEILDTNRTFAVGDVSVTAIDTPHDARGSVGFVFEARGTKLAYFTDLGRVTPAIREAVDGAECLFIESNHDVMSLLNGSYPAHLKDRILSYKGHLSNDDCGDLITDAVRWGVRRMTLCHLSRENNTPALAADCAFRAIERAGASASDGVRLSIAAPDLCCEPYLFAV